MIEVEVERLIPGRQDEVFARYCDHASWSDWAGLGRVHLERRGDDERDGVGALRVIDNLGFAVREEVIDFQPPERMRYRLLTRSIPVRDHEGEVLFEARGAQTRVVWRCRCSPLVPGTGPLLRLGLRIVFSRTLRRLERDRTAAGRAQR